MRTTTAGHAALLATWTPTEPTSRPRKPPMPRLPTTTMSALALASTSTEAGLPRATLTPTSSPGCAARASSARACVASWRRLSRSSMASGVRTEPPKRIPSRGTLVAAARVSITPRETASTAAQSTAMLACSEPSYPTMTPVPTVDLPFGPGSSMRYPRGSMKGAGGPGHRAEGPDLAARRGARGGDRESPVPGRLLP